MNHTHTNNTITSDDAIVHTVSNHPVHLMDKNGTIYPSALVPFCEFGGNISITGDYIKGLDIPVCNCFKEKFLDNQLCYEIDVNQFTTQVDSQQILNYGLTFIVDTNDNRQIRKKQMLESASERTLNIGKMLHLNVKLIPFGKFSIQ